MQDLQADIVIQSPPSRVWQILTDFAGFSAWNPYIREAMGDVSPGARLTVRLQPPGTRPMILQATILNVDAGRELAWFGRLWGIRGLFEGEQRFTIEALSSETVRLRQHAGFTGVLTAMPRLSGILAKRLQHGMTEMNEAVKVRAEQRA